MADHPPAQVALWQRAASFASFKHRHQLRKDGRTPYVSHVYRVAMTVRQVFSCEDPETIAAAMLHDLIEDTTTDYDDLASKFGTGVADMVAALTKNATLPKPRREVEYDAQLARADWRARIIKLADTYDNLSDSLSTPEAPVPVPDAIERARRAIALASADTAGHPESARAVRAVSELVASAVARMGQRASDV